LAEKLPGKPPASRECYVTLTACNQLLLGTEAPGPLEKEENGEYYKAEHISIPHMEPPAETVLPMLENAG
jgi:hypothetical protein